jgi:hypothetical protein
MSHLERATFLPEYDSVLMVEDDENTRTFYYMQPGRPPVFGWPFTQDMREQNVRVHLFQPLPSGSATVIKLETIAPDNTRS